MLQDSTKVSPPPAAGSPDDERWRLVEEILGSRTFAKANRLSSLLRYICSHALEGRIEEINEQRIGEQVFGRPASYNPADDSIVRTQARLLRQRLTEYFEHERPDAPLMVHIPRGGYVPVFQRVERAQAAVENSVAAVVAPAARAEARGARRWKPALGAGLACLLAAAGVLAYLHGRSEPSRPEHALWTAMLNGNRPTVIAVSDDALVLFQERTHEQVSLDDYLSGKYAEQPASPASKMALTKEWLNAHQYTSMADLQVANRIVALPEARRGYVETRLARDLRMSDLKDKNIVLIGGLVANPWVGLFASQLNFVVNYDWQAERGYVTNKAPRAGEPHSYQEMGPDGVLHNYGVLAFLPGLDGKGETLLLEGTGMAGTEATADFLFDDALFGAFARKIMAPPGRLPHFEVLVETTSIGGNSSQARVIAYRLLGQ